MQWQIVMVAAMLLIGGAVGFAELRRRAKPEQQRITEARQRFFAGEQPRVEVRAHEANLKSEPLVRLHFSTATNWSEPSGVGRQGS